MSNQHRVQDGLQDLIAYIDAMQMYCIDRESLKDRLAVDIAKAKELMDARYGPCKNNTIGTRGTKRSN